MPRLLLYSLILACLNPTSSFAQKAEPQAAKKLEAELQTLQKKIDALREVELQIEKDGMTRSRLSLLADVEVFAKAAEWILRHDEFYKPDYVQQTEQVIAAGMIRRVINRRATSIPASTVGN